MTNLLRLVACLFSIVSLNAQSTTVVLEWSGTIEEIVIDEGNNHFSGANIGETFSGIEQDIAVSLLSEITPFVPEGWSLADFALRWILDHDAVSSVIAGCSHPDQIARNSHASTLPPLDDSIHDALKAIYNTKIRQHIRCPI